MTLDAKDVVAAVSLFISLVAIFMSWRSAKAQVALTERLKAQDIDLDRKKLFTALWDKMSNLWEVRQNERGEYDETLVWENLNSLELIAVCWESNIVDQRMTLLVCGRNFVLRVGELEGIVDPLKQLRRTGKELLHDRPAILRVKRKFEEQLTS
jgi:hypothetical protein